MSGLEICCLSFIQEFNDGIENRIIAFADVLDAILFIRCGIRGVQVVKLISHYVFSS